MARSLRIEFPGAIYHCACRMVGSWQSERAWLFRDDRDRARFLEQLADRVEQHETRLYLFCLMANHFHLVFETPRANCAAFMQGLLTAYSVYFNRRHNRHGHLLDGRYKAKLVEGDQYLLALSRYVHLNPVKRKAVQERPLKERVKQLESHRWSSYPSYTGRRTPLEFVTYGPILGMMQGRANERPSSYRRFVEAGLAADDHEFETLLAESRRSIGSTAFRAWVDDLHETQTRERARAEDISFRHVTEPLDPDAVLATVAEVMGEKTDIFRQRRRYSVFRAIAAKFLIRYSGLNQRQVADLLDAGSGAAISKQLSRFAANAGNEKATQRRLKQIEKRLEALRKSVASTSVKS